MKKTKILLGLVILTALILGACSANQPVNNTMDNAMAHREITCFKVKTFHDIFSGDAQLPFTNCWLILLLCSVVLKIYGGQYDFLQKNNPSTKLLRGYERLA